MIGGVSYLGNDVLSHWRWITLTLIGCLAAPVSVVGQTQSNAAPDRIWLEPLVKPSASESWYPPALQSRMGRVVEFDAEQLEVVFEGDTIATSLAAERVIWIQPGNVAQVEGPLIDLYREQKYAEALSQLPPILQKRPAIWRQQRVTMLAADAAWRSGRSKIALELVSQLDRRPLPPLIIALLPIEWQRGVQGAESIREAESRLSDPSELVRLVAASWLLSSSKRNDATVALKQLATSDRRSVAFLAEALLWRVASPPQIQSSVGQWERRVNEMPIVLQPGPVRTLADRFAAAGLSEDAKRLQWATELVPIHAGLHR